VAAYLVPQCLAYGELAGVDPVRGLWAVLPCLLLYALLGSSPQLSVGPESTTAVMTAVAIAPLAAGDGLVYGQLASVLAVLVGVLCVVAAACRLGFLAELLSRPVLVGYMAGVALLMIRGQLSPLAGGGGGAIHGPTLLLGVGVLAFLLLLQWRFPKAPGPLLAM